MIDARIKAVMLFEMIRTLSSPQGAGWEVPDYMWLQADMQLSYF